MRFIFLLLLLMTFGLAQSTEAGENDFLSMTTLPNGFSSPTTSTISTTNTIHLRHNGHGHNFHNPIRPTLHEIDPEIENIVQDQDLEVFQDHHMDLQIEFNNSEEDMTMTDPENENETNFFSNLSTSDSDMQIPIRDPLYIVIPISLIYSLILLSGLVGNISTCIVISKNNYMHTATNYYLFSLAISDLLLLVSGLPQEMYLNWFKYPYIFGEIFCVGRGLAAESSANASVLTIAAFTVERYVAICHPLRSHSWSQLSRVIRIVLLIWIFAFALAIPQAAQFGVIDEMGRNETVLISGAWCSIKREIFPYAFQISIFVMFVIPMTIIAVLYILIGLKLRAPTGINRSSNQDLSTNVEPNLRNNMRHSQKHVIRMLEACSAAFFICWFPFHLQRFLAIYASELMAAGVSNETFLTVYKIINYLSGILYYVSTCINPILYHIMSNKFRQAFKDTLHQLCGRDTTENEFPINRTYSNLSHNILGRRSNRFLLQPQQNWKWRRRLQQQQNGQNGGQNVQMSITSPVDKSSTQSDQNSKEINGTNFNKIQSNNQTTRIIPVKNIEQSQDSGDKSGLKKGFFHKSKYLTPSVSVGGGKRPIVHRLTKKTDQKVTTSRISVNSSNTISNSSLQDLENEFTGPELAALLAKEHQNQDHFEIND